MIRRTFLRRAVTVGTTAVTIGSSTTSTTTGGFRNGTLRSGYAEGSGVRAGLAPRRDVVDLGEEGLTEGDVVDPYLSDHFDDGTEVHVPAGTYRWGGSGLDATANAALIGDGDVAFEVDSGVDASVVATEGTVLLKGITQVGRADDEGGVRTYAKSGARVVFDDFNRPDGAENNGRGYGFFVPTQHAGEAYFLNCTVAHFPNNGLYASGPQKGGQGKVIVEGGLYANNNVASIRIGSANSLVRGATIHYDERFKDVVGPNGGQIGRGLWVRFGGSNITIEDCDLTFAEETGGIGVPFGIQPRDNTGSGTVESVRINNHTKRWPILLHESVAEDWSGEGVHLTGSGSLFVEDPVEPWIACRSPSGDGCATATAEKGVADPAIRVWRENSPTSIRPGETASKVLRIAVGADRKRLFLNGTVDPATTEVTAGNVRFDEGDGDVTVATGSPGTLTIAIRNVVGPAEIVVPFEVTAPASAAGESLRFGGQVESDTRNVPIPPSTVRVVAGPVERADRDGDGSIDTAELSRAVNDWAHGEYTSAELNDIVEAWSEDS